MFVQASLDYELRYAKYYLFSFRWPKKIDFEKKIITSYFSQKASHISYQGN